MKIINNDPPVYITPNFLTNEECDHFISIGKKIDMKQAKVSGPNKGYTSQGRTGANCWITHTYDTATLTVAKRIAKYIKIPLENAEAFQIIYYKEHQEYRPHFDSWLHDNSEKCNRVMRQGGQRLITALCYLNTVEAGGGTQMTKLQKTITAEKGKLLIFHNCKHNSNERHPMSEHSGMPVIKGEKWAFNLWFREKPFNIIYNPIHESTPMEKYTIRHFYVPSPVDNKAVPISPAVSAPTNNIISKTMIIYNKLLKNKDLQAIATQIVSNHLKNNKNRQNIWLMNYNYNDLINNIEKRINIPRTRYENMCITIYPKDDIHRLHFNAYDINDAKNKKYLESKGQRVASIYIPIFHNFKVDFPKLQNNNIHILKPNDCLFFRNINNSTQQRDEQIIHEITHTIDTNTLLPPALLSIHIREKICPMELSCLYNIFFTEEIPLDNATNAINAINAKADAETNSKKYTDILNQAYELQLSSNKKIYTHKTMTFSHKVPTVELNGVLQKIKDYKEKYNTVLNKSLLSKKEYNFDEYNPVKCENIFAPQIYDEIKNYYINAINNNYFQLGDRQSQRYKAHNEALSRYIHYEILPVIEHISNSKLVPTYSYLSAYVKGADLPPHTDRSDCEISVSFIIDKPYINNANNSLTETDANPKNKTEDKTVDWPIYIDLKKQPVKYKGRYSYKPPNNNCITVDCSPGGIMMFYGTDHIHYREELAHEYYYILLLHFRKQ